MAITVLVVEDEPLIRMNAVTMIEDAGYEVIEAANADDAILLLETRSDIRVVFSDIEMPGSMDGLKLIHAVRGVGPRFSSSWRPVAFRPRSLTCRRIPCFSGSLISRRTCSRFWRRSIRPPARRFIAT